ncbi:MAG TPA: 2-dehydropantoate 2-reductase [Solirubrobacteraceae bacterium]|nr:2-dehydropantoate 2-reductase [Solirubrobacteraceae bacterium]
MSTRYVVFGAGAVGGVVGARLRQAGHEVALIARGAHLEAIRIRGLRLLTPVEDVTLEIPAAADPAELEVGRDGDVVLLAVKSQDTLGALDQLRAAGAREVPIVCVQNGVENERVAQRRFADVYGAYVLAPTNHLEPGVVEATGAKLSGFLHLGRYPSGTDARCEELAATLSGARFVARAVADVMRLKHAKLLLNLANVVGALFADDPELGELERRVRAEGEAVLQAAGIAHDDPHASDRETRWRDLGVSAIEGRIRGGSSTWQSLKRGTGSLETDYLNGEISLLGRLHGVPTPLNDALCRLADAHARRGGGPGELSLDVLREAVTAG